ncbi:MAG: hypothetical protein HN360_10635, partial [Rhodospirillaceae bacterium]|nr:hypothetical protein [Rhodospirillaceae bacterium]
GTFSSGKSTFINSLLGEKLQKTGNQAVDDKFTVVSYSHHDATRTLPGTALNNDPRFPFFRIGEEIDKVSSGEGKRIDNYLQLKTSSAETLKGRTLIDSPGFDADDQRRSTLRLTDHIIDISDLVLIFFDARHPEPGAMQDTLAHLVKASSGRSDSNKFLYVLNQIDTTAREDNPEEVVAAWQRALAQAGLTAGRFLCIYNEEAAYPIVDEALRERYQRKRDIDMKEITSRIGEVEIERSYRIVSSLEDAARGIERDVIPALEKAMGFWRKVTLAGNIVGVGAAAALAYGAITLFGIDALQALFNSIQGYITGVLALIAAVGVVGISWHYLMRNLAARFVVSRLAERFGDQELNLRGAFLKTTNPWRSIFSGGIAGWGKTTKSMIGDILQEIEGHIQRLNDQHTDPSGRKHASNEGDMETSFVPVAAPAVSMPDSQAVNASAE